MARRLSCVAVCLPLFAWASTEVPAPDHFGIGRAVDPETVARLDIDILPDGRGLPVGSGSATEGAAVYAAQCAACHGAQGEGGSAAALAGGDTDIQALARDRQATRSVGNYWPYATTLFDYMRRAMPWQAPGSLENNELYALTAHILALNGIVSADHVLDRSNLANIEMPARQHYRPVQSVTGLGGSGVE